VPAVRKFCEFVRETYVFLVVKLLADGTSSLDTILTTIYK